MSSTISSDQKKSLLLTTAIYAVILLLLFFIRFWPPYNPENNVALAEGGGGGGVTVNFGDSDLGSGANYKSEVLNVKNQAKVTPAKATPDEAIITQENTADDVNDVVIPVKKNLKNQLQL
jgi:hypothetical protein